MPKPSLQIRPISDYNPRNLQWLWPGRIPRGKLSILSGDPSLGKSLVTLDLAARLSANRPWPDEQPGIRSQKSEVSEDLGRGDDSSSPSFLTPDSCPLTPVPRRVLLLSAEDDVADTIRPRLEAAGADLTRVHILEGLRDEHGRRGYVALHQDCDAIADLLRQHGEWGLIIIDPISAYFDGLDPNSNRDVRSLLGRLADMAEQTGAAVLLVSHHRKGSYAGPAIHRTIGSLAFAAVARSVWSIIRDPADPDRRLFVPVKMNLAPSPPALAYRIASGSPTRQRGTNTNSTRQRGPADGSPTRQQGTDTNPTRQRGSAPPDPTFDLCPPTSALTPAPCPLTPSPTVHWDPWPVEILADDVAETAFAEADRADRLDVAKRWLNRQLQDGRLPSSEIKRRARAAGIGRDSLWDAKRDLNVTAIRDGDPPRWYWISALDRNTSGLEPDELDLYLPGVDPTFPLAPFPAPPPAKSPAWPFPFPPDKIPPHLVPAFRAAIQRQKEKRGLC